MQKCMDCGKKFGTFDRRFMGENGGYRCHPCAQGAKSEGYIPPSKPSDYSTEIESSDYSAQTESSDYSTGIGLASFISGLGWVSLVLSVLAIFALGSSSGIPGAIAGVYGAISSLFLVAAGQMLRATLDTANNTKQIAELLRAQEAKQ